MIPWFEWTTFQLGPLTIQVWGMFVALGMLLSVWLIYKHAARFDLKADIMIDLAIWMIVLGFVCARLVHVFFYEPAFYLHNPGQLFAIWHGGLSSFGGMIGALLGFFLYTKRKKIHKKDFLRMGDLSAWGALFGWIVGRIGCVMIHDHMGRSCDCFLAIGGPDQPRLEMAFLEILGLLPLALYFFIARKKKRPEGWYLSLLLMYYGALRFILDFFRATDLATSDARYLGLTPAQYFSIIMLFIGMHIYRKKVRQKK